MAEWLYEAGIGENRAALVEHGEIVEAALEWDDDGARVGDVVLARLVPGRRGLIAFGETGQALLAALPAGLSEGAALFAEIVREALPEPGRAKLAVARATAGPIAAGPDLLARVAATGDPVRTLGGHQPDLLEQAGWSELLDEAIGGEIAFPGGALRLSPTPAMALFDVDGTLAAAELACAGAAAAARAIRRLGIGGSIGIDLPTTASKAARLAAAAALDAALVPPFERTAVNGFGFVQIVRRRERMSLPERLRADPAGAAARALLRRAERAGGIGARTLVAAPAVLASIAGRPDWQEALARRVGAAIGLRAAPALAISAGYVETEHP